MSVEGGPSGGLGGAGAGVSVGPSISAGPSMSVGIEGGSLAGAVSVSGLARFDSGPAFGAAPVVAGPVNEGPVGLAALKLTVPLAEIKFNEPLSVPGVQAELGSILSQAQEPEIFSPVIPANAGIQLSKRSEDNSPRLLNESRSELDPAIRRDDKKMESAILPQVEPVIVSFPVPHVLEFPKPEAVVSPAVEPLVQPGLQIENQVFNEVKPIVLTQPALEEQETQQEMVMKRVTAKQIDIAEEEKEEVRLKNVVDEKVLETRIGEFGSAADRVGVKAKENSSEEKENDTEEIDGKEIVEQVPVETAEKRSGLVKKSGPDGSRVETIEEVASRKFKSIKEAREEIAAIIFKKPPVKKEKEGEEVGQEAVARVLKYRMVKSGPEAHTEAVERENILEDLGLAELFPKAA